MREVGLYFQNNKRIVINFSEMCDRAAGSRIIDGVQFQLWTKSNHTIKCVPPDFDRSIRKLFLFLERVFSPQAFSGEINYWCDSFRRDLLRMLPKKCIELKIFDYDATREDFAEIVDYFEVIEHFTIITKTCFPVPENVFSKVIAFRLDIIRMDSDPQCRENFRKICEAWISGRTEFKLKGIYMFSPGIKKGPFLDGLTATSVEKSVNIESLFEIEKQEVFEIQREFNGKVATVGNKKMCCFFSAD